MDFLFRRRNQFSVDVGGYQYVSSRLCSTLKMNLMGWLIASLVSMSNLTHLLDRIITDGKYESVLLINADPFIKYTDFFHQLAEASSGEYSMFIINADYLQTVPNSGMGQIPFRKHNGILQIIMLNYGDHEIRRNKRKNNRNELHRRCKRFKMLVRDSYNNYNIQNVVLLVPMRSDGERGEIWHCLDTMQSDIARINCIIIFYRTEIPITVANTTSKPIELFVLNPGEHVEVDVESSVCDECNLNDRIFVSIAKAKASGLVIQTDVGTEKSLSTTSVQRENYTLINFGNAEYYLSNFVARNLRAKNVEIHQTVYQHKLLVKGGLLSKISTWFPCNASSEKYYAELYNNGPSAKGTYYLLVSNH